MISFLYNASTAATAAAMAPTEPPIWTAPPVKCVDVGGIGEAFIGLVPLPAPAMLLTLRDGHGVLSDAFAELRVIIFGAAADGQLVPQGAVTVDVIDCGKSAQSFSAADETGIVLER